MNKHVLSLLYLLLCVVTIRAQKTISLKTLTEIGEVGQAIALRDIKETKNGVIVTYCLNNIILQDDPLYKNSKSVKIEGFWPNSNVGEPAVLSRLDTFVIPETGATIVISDSAFVEIPMEISPARPVLPNSGNDSFTQNNVLPISEFRGVFPSNLISTTRNDNYRGQQLLEVCITPVQYDYANKKVRVFTRIQYRVQYDVVNLKKSLLKFSKDRINGNTFLDNIALNIQSHELEENQKTSEKLTGDISSKYLIISVPKYATAVNRFAEWKRTLGFDVRISMRESWDTTMVKNVVHNAYDLDNIEYLLIIGGHNDVPGVIRDQIFNFEHHYHPTDLYYGCMSSGYTPDIFRGRILVSTSEEAMTVVDKIINYEKNPVDDVSFYRRGVHCAYFQDWNYYKNDTILVQPIDGYEDRRFVLTSERIRNGMLNIIDSIKRVYFTEDTIIPTHWNQPDFANGEEIPAELRKPSFAWNGSKEDIRDYINQKALYVLMRGHGSDYGWSKPRFSSLTLRHLNNGRFLPIVFSICCQTGQFDRAKCFCERFLKKENGGCVAIFGATESSLSGPNDVLAEGMFDAIWPSLNLRPQFGIINGTSYSPTPTPTYRLGQILDQGIKRTDEAYLNTNRAWYPRYTSELFHCFGDPSMMIYTEKPGTFSNATIHRLNNGMISVNTGGLLATISFYNRRTGEVYSYRGYSASYTGDSETSVCISAHNMIPYLDEGTLYIQNQTLADGGYFEAETIKVGKSVTNTHPHGNVNFLQGNYHLEGKQVELHPGTTISVGTTMEIKNK
ncbi:MAG: hypothetical protein J5545_12080 [Bacteroidaceae bacterium]|nr:hypothetical protein [Bacteroidaceae bacterium]